MTTPYDEINDLGTAPYVQRDRGSVLGAQFNKKTPPGLTPEGIAEHHQQSDEVEARAERRTAREEMRDSPLESDDER